MGAAFVCKAFEDAATQPEDGEPAKQIWFADVDKFALCAFNQLAYNQKISGCLTASFFLELSKYYTLYCSIRRINLHSLCRKFALLLFAEEVNANFSDKLIPFN